MALPFRHASASGDSTLRHHRAAEGLLEGGYEFVLRLDGDIKPVVLLGEALGLDEALLACPGETLHPQTDDVNKYWNARFEHEPKWAKHMLKEPEERTRELGKAEAQALEAAIRCDYAPFFDFVHASGQRAFKERLLRRSEVNLSTRQIVKKGKQDRTITIPITG